MAVGADNVGYPGTTPVISSNGTKNGIVWVVQSDGAASSKAATLRAYDAANIATELYNSGLNGKTDLAGPGGEVRHTHHSEWQSLRTNGFRAGCVRIETVSSRQAGSLEVAARPR